MNSQEFINKLKEILPGREYAENSKRAILAAEQYPKWSFIGSLTESLGTGMAIVLAGALLVLVMGGFSSLNPFSLKSLDPAGLKAEAEAIDIQIRLSNLDYNAFTRVISEKKAVSTLSVISDDKTAENNSKLTAVIDETVSSSTENVGVDDVLLELSK
jgi:hypothetical protein